MEFNKENQELVILIREGDNVFRFTLKGNLKKLTKKERFPDLF